MESSNGSTVESTTLWIHGCCYVSYSVISGPRRLYLVRISKYTLPPIINFFTRYWLHLLYSFHVDFRKNKLFHRENCGNVNFTAVMFFGKSTLRTISLQWIQDTSDVLGRQKPKAKTVMLWT